MKKIVFSIFLSVLPLLLTAQPSYKEILARMPQLSAHEALYELTDYQAFFPTQPHTYYMMGSINYGLIPTEHPILDYNELHLCLYNTRLYYGNCLHFAAEQSLKTEFYPGVPHADKRITTADLNQFLKARMDTVEQIMQKTDKLYDSFYTLVEHYNCCTSLFSEFVGRYERQKNASLLLTETDQEQLRLLQQKADSLPLLIEHFRQALSAYPIEGYTPQISMQPIELYRIDGLTAADFLQNEVILWDYSQWVQSFTANQEQGINRLRQSIDSCQEQLLQNLRLWQNPTTYYATLPEMEDNSVLLNRIERIDYESFLTSLLRAETLYLSASMGTHSNLFQPDYTAGQESLTEALSLLYRLREEKTEANRQAKSVRQRFSAEARLKHAGFLNRFYPSYSVQDSLSRFMQNTDSLLLQAQINTFENMRSFYKQRAAEPLPALPKKWRVPAAATEQLRQKNDLTSEYTVVYATPSESSGNLLSVVRLSAEGTELTRLELRMEGMAREVLQVNDQWLLVLDWQQYATRSATYGNGVMTVLFNAAGKVERMNFYQTDRAEQVTGALKLTSNLIALLTETDGKPHLRFLNAQGVER